ncbi:hypothetical protein [Rhodococcus qingshengii]|uniref:hypothetical protein n=1 Tax=Rhodococcus qingshengii TaxID=334542 RepID=UPI0027A6D065|nr:hypothetical protein PI247_29795 [Rhodococcus qingshengii]
MDDSGDGVAHDEEAPGTNTIADGRIREQRRRMFRRILAMRGVAVLVVVVVAGSALGR